MTIKTQQDIEAGYLVKKCDGSAILADGNNGGWIIVGCGSEKMYHTMFNMNDITLTNKAGLHQYDVDWVFNAKGFSIKEMINITSDNKLLRKYSNNYLVWERSKVMNKLEDLYK